MAQLKAVTVFLGSSLGNSDIYRDAAVDTGRIAAETGVTVVYGGGTFGCMGVLAQSALDAGGKVIGVMPTFMFRYEGSKKNCTEVFEVESMHERKLKMQSLADAFIILPGGFGTLEELFEILTWRKLGIHNKPMVFVNINGYYDGLLAFVDHMVTVGFVSSKDRYLVQTVATPAEAFEHIKKELANPTVAVTPIATVEQV